MADLTQITAERVARATQTRVNPIRELTARSLVMALDAFDQGNLREAALLWEKIAERDDLLPNVIGKRYAAASVLDWEIVEQAAGGAVAKAHADALTEFYNSLTTTNAMDRNESGGVALLVAQMMTAVGNKYACHEILWQPGKTLSATFNFAPLYFFENRTGKLRFLKQDFDFTGVDLDPNAWLITTGPGIMKASALLYVIKHFPINDWLSYCETAGNPGLHAKTAAPRDSDAWKALEQMLATLGVSESLLTDLTTELKTIDRSLTNVPFEALINRADRMLASLWRGGDLSTMSSDAKGVPLQQDEGAVLESADAQRITGTLNTQVDRRVIAWHFGAGVVPMASFKLKPRARLNVQLELQKWRDAASMGVELSVDDFRENFNLPKPAPGAVMLKPPATPSLPINPLSLPNALPSERMTIASGLREDFAPLANAIGQLAESNEPITAERVQALLAKFPALAAEVLSNAEAADQFNIILSRAAAAGAVAGAAARKFSTN